jgi:hypothetical protein
MAFLDDLDLSKLIAPAGYTPAQYYDGAGAAPAPAPVQLPPGGPPQLPSPMAEDAAQGPQAPPAGLLGANPAPDAGAAGGPSPGGNAAPQGFLQKLMSVDPQGNTFQDRLMALGAMLKGDTNGAQDYLFKRQELVQKQNQLQLARIIAQMQTAAIAKAHAGGGIDPQAYADTAGAGADPDQLLKLMGMYTPKYTPVITRQGGVGAMEEHTGAYQEDQAPVPQKPGMLMQAPDGSWVPNPAYISAAGQLRDAQAAATAAHRAPPRAGAGKGPKSYGAGDVTW